MKKYLNIKSGSIRNKKGLEINWSIYNWALPLYIDFRNEYLIFIRFFCVSLIIPKKKLRLMAKNINELLEKNK